MKHTILALFLFMWSFPDFAACEKNVQKINTGVASPCTAWLVSEEQMQEFAKQTDKLDLTEKLQKTNEQLLKLSETEIEYYKQKNKAQTQELEKAETRRFLATAGAFALGVVLTGIAAKAAIESSK